MLSFMTPWALVLLLLLPATAALGYARLQRLPGRRGPIALAMRLSVVALLVGALAGPQWRLLERRVSVVFLVDASASVGPAGQHSGMDWAAHAVPAAGPRPPGRLALVGRPGRDVGAATGRVRLWRRPGWSGRPHRRERRGTRGSFHTTERVHGGARTRCAHAACSYHRDTVGRMGRLRPGGLATPQWGVVVLRTSNVDSRQPSASG